MSVLTEAEEQAHKLFYEKKNYEVAALLNKSNETTAMRCH